MMVDRMRLPSSSPAYPSFYSILALTRQTKTTDPRDKIFALLGLVRNLENLGQFLAPDYYKTNVANVYTDVVINFIHTPEFFRILQLIPDVPPL